MSSDLAGETAVVIPGPEGDLEARVMGAAALEAGSGRDGCVAVVCHPHSQHGGSMQNKVVHTLCRTFREAGLPSVRFNFRGVGASAGTYDAGIGETDDLLAVFDWLQSQHPLAGIWLAGFSFGGFVAARGARALADRGEFLRRLVLVAPAVVNFDFDGLLPVPAPTIVVQGGEDDVVAPDAVIGWAEALDPRPALVRMPEAGHFFHGMLPALKTRLLAELDAAS